MDQSNNQSSVQPDQAGQDSGDQVKALGIVGYIFPILFFLPLVMDIKGDKNFALYHANQQLNLLLFWVIGWVIALVTAFIIIGLLLMPLIVLAGLIFMILGIVNVVNNRIKPLPIIGGFNLLK